MLPVESKTVTISQKGWVVIPSSFRKEIGLKPGMKMTVTREESRIILTPQDVDVVDRLYGKLDGGDSLTEALLKERTKDRDSEKNRLYSG